MIFPETYLLIPLIITSTADTPQTLVVPPAPPSLGSQCSIWTLSPSTGSINASHLPMWLHFSVKLDEKCSLQDQLYKLWGLIQNENGGPLSKNY